MKKINLNDYLSTKDNLYKKEFEDAFIKYFAITRNQYYKNIDNFLLKNKELKKIKKIINMEKKNKNPIFLLGYKWFFNEKFYIKKGVFVPQTDTEGLIELILKENNSGNVLEIGSGSGVIPISLALHKNFFIDSFDKNKKAIKLANYNYISKKTKIKGKINFINKDFTKFLFNKNYDIITSNPPYLKKGDKKISKWVLKNQPPKALYAKKEELYFYKEIFKLAKNQSSKKTKIYLEIGFNQKEKIENLIKNYNFKSYKFFKDLSNNYRYLKIEK